MSGGKKKIYTIPILVWNSVLLLLLRFTSRILNRHFIEGLFVNCCRNMAIYAKGATERSINLCQQLLAHLIQIFFFICIRETNSFACIIHHKLLTFILLLLYIVHGMTIYIHICSSSKAKTMSISWNRTNQVFQSRFRIYDMQTFCLVMSFSLWFFLFYYY